ncbi:MAG TPA: Uma2 family endonuclease [Nitrospiraceae bacterium]|nr:Uma2 family endonuclease [Nitrospiraceae bacterium]
MSLTRVKLTYEEYYSLSEETRPSELIDGELYMPPSPSPKHQSIVVNLVRALDQYVRANNLGKVFVSPLDVVLDRARPLIVQPDLLFISMERLSIVGNRIEGAPDLVVEVFSPATATRDRTEKAMWYGQYYAREYWLVDPENRSLEVRRLSPKGYETLGLYGGGQILSSDVLAGINLPIDLIFA